ncbi:MAG: hypothetical protein M3O34_13140 [Chloroflexota bacterium]|nr:hypothetical protein [Chloroflexota bacterium]
MPTLISARMGGLALMLGGPVWLWGLAGLDETIPPYSHAGGHLLLALAGLLSLVGLLGTRARIAGRAGRPGAVGLALACVGAVLVLVGNSAEGLFEAELGWGAFSVGMLALLIGLAVFGFAALRTGALPRWGATPLVIVPPVLLLIGVGGTALVTALGVPEPAEGSSLEVLYGLVMGTVYAACWVLLGYSVWSYRRGERLTAPTGGRQSS